MLIVHVDEPPHAPVRIAVPSKQDGVCYVEQISSVFIRITRRCRDPMKTLAPLTDLDVLHSQC
jgi:hypothetical protein